MNDVMTYIFCFVDLIPSFPNNFIVINHQTANWDLSILKSIRCL